MICQSCGKAEATTHFKRIINGEVTEGHLCSDCAKALGVNDMFSGFDFGFSDLLSEFFADSPVAALSANSVKCENCGSSFSDIVKSGRIGCADCYETFFDKLMPSIQRLHGNTKHEGKVPLNEVTNEPEEADEIATLREKMNKAIENEDFEEAAELRDKIKELEGKKNG
ncbi:MAG: UvrB/UvrC motif-containing protein [Clostridiales bacterium]|nr:UvrB/UvrC motif-containing protein [Clostridia bacterium]MCR4563573.1 UvrB/UvrC motif-containing protein [Clostridiales bacterium]